MNSRLVSQIKELVATLNTAGIQFALIGGLALSSYKVIRATQDIDLLIDTADGDAVNNLLLNLGYHCLHRSSDAANYTREDERVDMLYAERPIARRLLGSAAVRETSFGRLGVVSAEGLIGFKLQAIVNNPKRTMDREDIRALLRMNRDTLNMAEIREYFQLFGQEALLEEMLHEIS